MSRSLVRAPRRALAVLGAVMLSGASIVVADAVTSSSAGASPAFTSPAPGSIQAASTCNGNTCQYIDGTGTKVTEWYSQTTAPSATCTHANFYASGTLVAQSDSICLSAGQSTSAEWDPGSFSAGTKLCSQWTNISGKPCDTIKG